MYEDLCKRLLRYVPVLKEQEITVETTNMICDISLAAGMIAGYAERVAMLEEKNHEYLLHGGRQADELLRVKKENEQLKAELEALKKDIHDLLFKSVDTDVCWICKHSERMECGNCVDAEWRGMQEETV